ncbi:FkbM family methyltransferase [Frankia sp. Cppng1_Ct_nod]|uniref:FkbM family methyltransferase n=1 Tax=Frankia sp. Cppng1_Ct_nod TaxID=2897162 RepID=UPI0010417A6F|nr:FkbM family methyltransferase [Frankia sp. Cppng1_Ct_nod]
MTAAPGPPADSWPGAAMWSAIVRVGQHVGVERCRPAVAVVMRLASLRPGGHARSSYRLVSGTPSVSGSPPAEPAEQPLRRTATPPRPAAFPGNPPHPGVRIRFRALPEPWWTRSPVVRTRRLGLRLELDLRDNLQRSVYFTGTYEPATLDWLRRNLRAGDVFVDVGAHVGVHALTAAAALDRQGHGRVIAFEPAADSHSRLVDNARRNGLRVTAVPLALGEATGEATLYTDPEWGADDAGVRSQYGLGEAIATVRVMDFDGWARAAGLTRMDVVKIDVEGAELAALAGMAASLTTFRPRALIVECRERLLARAGTGSGELTGFLAGLGYRSTDTDLDRNQLFERVDT